MTTREYNFIDEYGKLVLAEIERQNRCSETLSKEVRNMRSDMEKAHTELRNDIFIKVSSICNEISSNRESIAVLNSRAGVWGLLGGIIPSTILLALYLIKTIII